jgi:glycosyltransferase involved in cell wall biosynthesis
MEEIKFSVIVANYNNGKYLVELIESILKQTYPHWELVITDDCSTDNSLEILSKYSEDIRIKVVKHNKNLGASAAFRTATEHATGEIIGMLGADDALPENALEVMTKAHMQNSKASFVYSTFYYCDENLEIQRIENKVVGQVEKGGSLIDGFKASSFATFKKEYYLLTEGFDIKFKAALDMDMFLKLEEVGELVFVNEPLYYYRKNPQGISQTNSHYTSQLFALLAVLKAYHRRKKTGFHNLKPSIFQSYASVYYYKEAEAMTLHHKNKNAFYFLLRLLWLSPLHLFEKHFWEIIFFNFGLLKTLKYNVSLPKFWKEN